MRIHVHGIFGLFMYWGAHMKFCKVWPTSAVMVKKDANMTIWQKHVKITQVEWYTVKLYRERKMTHTNTCNSMITSVE